MLAYEALFISILAKVFFCALFFIFIQTSFGTNILESQWNTPHLFIPFTNTLKAPHMDAGLTQSVSRQSEPVPYSAVTELSFLFFSNICQSTESRYCGKCWYLTDQTVK